jgi:hypothetical protein
VTWLCLNSGGKVLECHIGYYIEVSHVSVRIIIIIKQIIEVLSTLRDELIKPK